MPRIECDGIKLQKNKLNQLSEEFGSKALRVTYKQEGDKTVIITAVFKNLGGVE